MSNVLRQKKKRITRQLGISNRHLKGIYKDFLHWDALSIYRLEREEKKKKWKESKEKGKVTREEMNV